MTKDLPSSDDLLQTRHSLLSRLKDYEDNDSWQDFFDTYWKLIYSFALRSGLNDAQAQDVVQETIIAVARQMAERKYDRAKGSFKRWLLQLTSWRIGDQRRKRQRDAAILEPAPDTSGGTPWAETIPDPAGTNELVWDEEWQRNLTDAAVRQLKKKVKARQFQIFDLYVIKRWPIAKVAATMRVNVGQVYLTKHRLTSLLKKEIRSLEARY